MAEKKISQGDGQDVYAGMKTDVEIGETSALSHSIESSDGADGIFSRMLRKIEIEPQPGSFAPGRWSNKDLDPVPEKDRTWRTYNYVMYWISDAFGPGNWRLGSSLISLGLSWKLTLGVIALGHFLISLIITVNGVIGTRYYFAFTIQARSAFGFKFSFVMVVIRMIVAIFWYGINTYTGAECVRSMIYAMAPGFRNIPNHLPESANITTQMMICFFIYFCLVMPFHFIPPQKMRWFFTFKSTFTPIAGFAIMGWILNATGGTNTPLFKAGSTVSGRKLTWAFMSALNAMLANYATLAVNINDFTRYAKKSRMTYIQIFIIPAAFLLMGFWGIVGASGSQLLYGEILWDPLLLIDRWTSPGGRAAAFFCGLAFCIAQIGANLSANAIAAANDMNAMFPRYINIRRGQILTAIIGAWVLTPWNILTSAAGLLNFMSGYTIWLAPISGILLGDYYFVRRQTLIVEELYRPDGIYNYGNKYSTNWRAVVSFNVAWIPLLPGFCQSIKSNIGLSQGGVDLYNLGYIYGFFSSLTVYCLLSYIWKPTSTLHHHTQ